MRLSLTVVAACAVAGCQLPYGGPGGVILGSRGTQPSESVDIRAVERELIDEVNEARAAQEAPGLAINAAMMRAAREHAVELSSRHELDHASTRAGRETFADRLELAGAPDWTLAGENLMSLPFTASDIADEAVRGWLQSPSHRTQMLEPTYTDTGVGVVRDDHGDWFIVQLFIRRR